jgi:lipoprotein signal peptidase
MVSSQLIRLVHLRLGMAVHVSCTTLTIVRLLSRGVAYGSLLHSGGGCVSSKVALRSIPAIVTHMASKTKRRVAKAVSLLLIHAATTY